MTSDEKIKKSVYPQTMVNTTSCKEKAPPWNSMVTLQRWGNVMKNFIVVYSWPNYHQH